MKRAFLVSSGLFLSVLSACAPSASLPAPAQQARTPAANAQTDNGWPREFKSDGQTITVFQPQVEKWKGNLLQERAAVSVESPASPQPVYGVIWISARTDVDRPNHMVVLEDLKVTKASFPSNRESEPRYLAVFRKSGPKILRYMALERLEASLALAGPQEHKFSALRNVPPKIFYSMVPATLVLIDGKPVLRDSGVKNFLRAINTRALLLLERSSGRYYLFLGDRWMQAASPEGPWQEAPKPSGDLADALEKAKEIAVSQKKVDLFDDPRAPVMQELKKGAVPILYVSEVPAALIQTQGKAQLQPIPKNSLLYVSNTVDSIFLDPRSQDYYVLLEGRWYRSANLNGPWEFVSARKLPKEFAKIPENHPKGWVLSSVAGTPEAQEAGIVNGIPQTATVDRKKAVLNVQYDGKPEFKEIEGTSLRYAVNTATPVIEVDPHSFYAVENGVWFVAASPTGPWTVATRIPAVIYTIPPSSPVYYVTYVRVYGYTPEVVYVGYTPGYLGSYLCSDGTVVLGTGYVYPTWVGTVWIGPPVLGWWGWWGWPGYWGYWSPQPVTVTVNQVNLYGANVYQAWSGPVVRNAWEPHEFANRNRFVRPNLPDNVYAGGLGNVYRFNGHGWEQKTPRGWDSYGQVPADLERERMARQLGENRWDTFRGGGPPQAAAPAPVAPPPRFAAPAAPPPAAPPAPPAGRAGQISPGRFGGR